MKIVNRTNMVNQLTNNYVRAETSILPMLVTNPIILIDWYHINKNRSNIVEGFNNVDGSYISEESKIVFDKISNLPAGGLDNLLMESTYDEDLGWTADFSSNGFLFANTVSVTENDYFVVSVNFNEKKKLIFKVTEHKRDYVKNMSINQFDYSFSYDSPEKYEQLEKQVYKRYTCLSSHLGPDSSLIVEESAILTLREKVENYVGLVDEFKYLFFSQESGNLVLPINAADKSVDFLDRVFIKVLSDNRVIFFDPIIDFAKSEFAMNIRPILCEAQLGVQNHEANVSIVNQLLKKSINNKVTLFPDVNALSSHIAKYQNTRLVYANQYVNIVKPTIEMTNFDGAVFNLDLSQLYVFDEEFLQRITDNLKYDDNIIRNIIIGIYNNEVIDYDNLELDLARNADCFYLFPIILNDYRTSIQNLIK